MEWFPEYDGGELGKRDNETWCQFLDCSMGGEDHMFDITDTRGGQNRCRADGRVYGQKQSPFFKDLKDRCLSEIEDTDKNIQAQKDKYLSLMKKADETVEAWKAEKARKRLFKNLEINPGN